LKSLPSTRRAQGDIFHAGFAYALVQGWGLARALEIQLRRGWTGVHDSWRPGRDAAVHCIENLIRTAHAGPAVYSQEQLAGSGAER